MQDHLSRFEERLQRLVEGGFARLFAGRLHPREVAVELIHAMEDHAYPGVDGTLIAPDIYLIRLNPQDHTAILMVEPQLAQSLAEELIDMARASGLVLLGYPEVRLLADELVDLHHVIVAAQVRGASMDTAEGLIIAPGESQLPEAPKASLIMNGDRYVVIDRPILNVGRHRENHLILDDARVSRHHAQIRLRFGRYILFDLGSSGGTTVNGEPIREAILEPGDVIGLAGVNLIYIEDPPAPSPTGDDRVRGGTEPFPPASL